MDSTDNSTAFHPKEYKPGLSTANCLGEDVWGLMGRPADNLFFFRMLFYTALAVSLVVLFKLIHNQELNMKGILLALAFPAMAYPFALCGGVVIDRRSRTLYPWRDWIFHTSWRALPLDGLVRVEVNEDPANNSKDLARLLSKKRFHVAMVFSGEKFNVFWGLQTEANLFASKLEAFVEAPESNTQGLDISVRDNASPTPQAVRLLIWLGLLLVLFFLTSWFKK